MAWIFSLSAECGQEEAVAEQFASHFNELSLPLSNGSQSHCSAGVFQDSEDNWWCRVCPSGISQIGIDTPETAYIMTELGLLIYQNLRAAPPFRYALVGVEVDEFRSYSELLEDAAALTLPGLVLAQSVWQAVGSPPAFHPFSLGYVWQPYEGEVYKPLMASSDLQSKWQELLILE